MFNICLTDSKSLSLTWGQVVGDYVVRDVSVQNHLESRQRVVAQSAVDERPVRLPELSDVHVVVEHDGARRLLVAFDPGALHEDHLAVVVWVGPNLELARLEKRVTL